jgi:hypothetical protein
MTYKNLTCFLITSILTATLLACQAAKVTPTKTHTCQQIQHKINDLRWNTLEADNTHTNLNKQQLTRQWHDYQCDAINQKNDQAKHPYLS